MNGLLKTLIKPDWDDNPKRSEILNAANLLQIGEFQLIQLAYKVWYKEKVQRCKQVWHSSTQKKKECIAGLK